MRLSREREKKRKMKEKMKSFSKSDLINEISRLKRLIEEKDKKIKELKSKLKGKNELTYSNRPYITKNTTINHSIIIDYEI